METTFRIQNFKSIIAVLIFCLVLIIPISLKGAELVWAISVKTIIDDSAVALPNGRVFLYDKNYIKEVFRPNALGRLEFILTV